MTGLEAMLNGLWQGIALAAAVWCLLRMLPRTNAATRYVVWMAVLLAVCALPPLHSRRWRPELPAGRERPVVARAATTVGNARATRPAILVLAGRWPPYLLAVWLAGMAAMLARVGRDYYSARQLKRRSRPAEAGHQARLDHSVGVARLTRPVRLAQSGEITTPISMGLGDPVILLPETGELSDAEVEQVVLHELGHIRRWDDWTKLVQKLAEAVFFFHPAVLWIARRLDFEREVACDDWVVSLTGERRSYAACLTRLVELSAAPEMALGAAGGKQNISRRIEMVLDQARNAAPGVSRAILAVAVVAIVAGVIVAAQAPPAVRQAEPSQPAQSLEGRMKALEEQMRLMQEQTHRLAEEKKKELEPKIRDVQEQKVRELNKQMQKIQEEALRQLDLGPAMRQVEKKIEQLREEKLRAVEPKLRELQRQIEKVQEEKLRELEQDPRMHQLEQEMNLLREEKLREVGPKIQELMDQAQKLQDLGELRELEKRRRR